MGELFFARMRLIVLRSALSKVELVDNGTRVYVNLENSSEKEVSFYTYDTKAVQGGKQLEQKSVYDDDDIPSSLLPDTTATGYLVFPKVNSDELKIFFKAPYASDYTQQWEDVEFTVNIESFFTLSLVVLLHQQRKGEEAEAGCFLK